MFVGLATAVVAAAASSRASLAAVSPGAVYYTAVISGWMPWLLYHCLGDNKKLYDYLPCKAVEMTDHKLLPMSPLNYNYIS